MQPSLLGAPGCLHQRQKHTIQFLVGQVCRRDFPKKSPVLNLLYRVSGSDLRHWTEGLDFQKIIIREHLERTSEISVGLRRVSLGSLHEYLTVQQISSPGIRIERA